MAGMRAEMKWIVAVGQGRQCDEGGWIGDEWRSFMNWLADKPGERERLEHYVDERLNDPRIWAAVEAIATAPMQERGIGASKVKRLFDAAKRRRLNNFDKKRVLELIHNRGGQGDISGFSM